MKTLRDDYKEELEKILELVNSKDPESKFLGVCLFLDSKFIQDLKSESGKIYFHLNPITNISLSEILRYNNYSPDNLFALAYATLTIRQIICAMFNGNLIIDHNYYYFDYDKSLYYQLINNYEYYEYKPIVSLNFDGTWS